MKSTRAKSLIVAALVGAATALAGTAFAQSPRWDDLSKLPFTEGYPTAEASARLYDELLFQRAVQVYLWALPAMNMVAMRDGQSKLSASLIMLAGSAQAQEFPILQAASEVPGPARARP